MEAETVCGDKTLTPINQRGRSSLINPADGADEPRRILPVFPGNTGARFEEDEARSRGASGRLSDTKVGKAS